MALWPDHGIARLFLKPGGVAERSMAAVLKTVERKFRGFESHPHRHVEGWKVVFGVKYGEMAEWLKALPC